MTLCHILFMGKGLDKRVHSRWVVFIYFPFPTKWFVLADIAVAGDLTAITLKNLNYIACKYTPINVRVGLLVSELSIPIVRAWERERDSGKDRERRYRLKGHRERPRKRGRERDMGEQIEREEDIDWRETETEKERDRERWWNWQREKI